MLDLCNKCVVVKNIQVWYLAQLTAQRTLSASLFMKDTSLVISPTPVVSGQIVSVSLFAWAVKSNRKENESKIKWFLY